MVNDELSAGEMGELTAVHDQQCTTDYDQELFDWLTKVHIKQPWELDGRKRRSMTKFITYLMKEDCLSFEDSVPFSMGFVLGCDCGQSGFTMEPSK